MTSKHAEEMILEIANMIYAREGCVGRKSLKKFFDSGHPAESSAAELALNIYNLITNSEHEEEEFT